MSHDFWIQNQNELFYQYFLFFSLWEFMSTTMLYNVQFAQTVALAFSLSFFFFNSWCTAHFYVFFFRVLYLWKIITLFFFSSHLYEVLLFIWLLSIFKMGKWFLVLLTGWSCYFLLTWNWLCVSFTNIEDTSFEPKKKR